MQIRVGIFLLLFSCCCFSSCMFGKKKKTIVAEVLCGDESYATDAKTLQKERAARTNRVKKLLLDPQMLGYAASHSGFKHNAEEMRQSFSFQNPEGTAILEIRFRTTEVSSAEVFMDTLLAQLVNYDTRDELLKSGKEIDAIQLRLDSVALVHDRLEIHKEKAALEENEKLLLELLRQRAQLAISRAAIVPQLKIIERPHEAY